MGVARHLFVLFKKGEMRVERNSTVSFSVFAHGIGAAPAARWYGKLMADEEIVGADAAEVQEVPAMRVRGPAA